MPEKESFNQFLKPTEFINSDNVKVITFVNDVVGVEKDKKKQSSDYFTKYVMVFLIILIVWVSKRNCLLRVM